MKRTCALLAMLILSACSGGGSSVPGLKSAAATGTRTGAALAIRIPHAASAAGAARRTPAYISAATESISITVYPNGGSSPLGGYPQTFDLTPGSPGCVQGDMSTVCTISLPLSPGSYSISLTTYDGPSGTGNALSVAQSVPATIVQGQANTIAVALGGVPVSLQLLASNQTAVAQEHVVTLSSHTTGAIAAYALDADGEEIIGAGAPAISASTDNGAQIAVAQPTSGQLNTIGLVSLATNAIAHVTITATPAAGTGAAAVSRWVTVQDPAMALVYIISSYAFNIFDQTATDVTPSAAAISGIQQGAGAVGATYDSANGLIYVSVQATPSYIVAFDKSGNPVPLNAGASGLALIEGIAYDPVSGYIYAGNNNVAIDGSGNAHSIATTLPGYYAFMYDAADNAIFAGPNKYDAGGSSVGSLPFPSSGGVQAETYNAANGLLYIATAYPTGVEVYNTSGAQQSTTGAFAVDSGAFIGAIGADPGTGNVYVATNTRETFGFDRQGNPLPAPWHTIPNAGAGSDAGNVLLITP